MNTITKSILRWFYSLVKLAISGAATTILTQTGLTVAQSVGVNVQPLNLQGMGIVALSGILGAILPYLQKSPLPQFKELEDTDPPFKVEPNDRTKT